MRIVSTFTTAVTAALAMTGCASTVDLQPTRAVSKKDAAACAQRADRAVNEPERRNTQTAVAVGSTIGAGLVGLVVASASQSAEDKALGNKVTAECLSKRGYKMVPKKAD